MNVRPVDPGENLTGAFADRFFVRVKGPWTRLTFGEGSTYHTAVVLPTVDAVELAQVITRIVNREGKE